MTLLAKVGIDRTPMLNGEIYCSPRCGCGCLRRHYDRAVIEAQAMCERLGPSWEPRIWENTGWHWVVTAADGLFEISPYRRRADLQVEGYTAWIHTRPQFISGIHPDPKDAMREAIGKMQAIFDQVAGGLDAARLLEGGA